MMCYNLQVEMALKSKSEHFFTVLKYTKMKYIKYSIGNIDFV